jgi:hypothetical protein
LKFVRVCAALYEATAAVWGIRLIEFSGFGW